MTVHSASVIAAKVLFSTPVVIGAGSSVDHPATTVYSNGFETDVASWTGSPARVNMPGSSAAAHTGVYAMLTSRSSGVTDLTTSLTVAGLVVGRSYTLTVWAAGAAATGYTAKIGVTGLSTSAVATLGAYSSSANYTQLSYTFTATATSHVLALTASRATTGAAYAAWDDVTLTQNAYTDSSAPVAVSEAVLDVKSGTLTLDDSWAPYGQGTLVCFAPGQLVIEAINPLAVGGLRVSATVTHSFGTGTEWNNIARDPVTRTFNLALRVIEVDHNTGEMTLTLESDEALLRDFAKMTSTAERVYGLSVKNAVTYALAKIGATLQAGASDATLQGKTLDPVYRNLCPNPSTEVNATGWSHASTGNDVSRSTAFAYVGTASLLMSSNTSGQVGAQMGVGADILISCVPGDKFTWTFWARSNFATAITPFLRFTTGTAIADQSGTTVNVLANVWTQITVTATCPAGYTGMNAYWLTTAGGVGLNVYTDANMLTANVDSPPDYFDGSYAGSNDGVPRDPLIYVPAWTGTAHASASTLTEQPNTDATVWQPGVSAWDWVSPLVSAGGLRLYCDEQRRWYLVSTVVLAGLISLSPDTGIERAADTRSLNDDSDYYTGVVIAYQAPSDPTTGLTPAPVYDIAGTQGRVLSLSYDTPSPGAGAAAAVLNRAQGKGRTLSVTSESNYLTTPGQSLSITLPDTPVQTGAVSSVSWSFPEARMTVGSRGLTTTPANAWLFAVGPWTAATGSWTAATGTN